jgi:hypothetical protein
MKRKISEILMKLNLTRFQEIINKIFFRVIKLAMLDSVLCCLGFLVPAALTISSWAVAPLFSEGELQLPLAAWYPFSVKSWQIYTLMFIFQIYGIAQSATFNISTDTIAAALLVHAKAQLEKLGIMLSKVLMKKKLMNHWNILQENHF